MVSDIILIIIKAIIYIINHGTLIPLYVPVEAILRGEHAVAVRRDGLFCLGDAGSLRTNVMKSVFIVYQTHHSHTLTRLVATARGTLDSVCALGNSFPARHQPLMINGNYSNAFLQAQNRALFACVPSSKVFHHHAS